MSWYLFNNVLTVFTVQIASFQVNFWVIWLLPLFSSISLQSHSCTVWYLFLFFKAVMREPLLLFYKSCLFTLQSSILSTFPFVFVIKLLIIITIHMYDLYFRLALLSSLTILNDNLFHSLAILIAEITFINRLSSDFQLQSLCLCIFWVFIIVGFWCLILFWTIISFITVLQNIYSATAIAKLIDFLLL